MVVGVMAISVLFFMSSFTLAQTDLNVSDNVSSLNLGDAGITPDSVFYGIDRAIENLRLALTFGDIEKAKKSLEIADERLAEVKEMIEQNKLDKAEIAQKNHDELLKKVSDLINKVESNGNSNQTEKVLEDIISLEIKSMSHSEKIYFLKKRILQKNYLNVTDEQFSNFEKIFSNLELNSLNTEDNAFNKKEKVKLRYKVLSNKSDEEINDFELEVEDNEREHIEYEDKYKFESREGKTKVEVKGDVEISSETKDILNSLVESLKGNKKELKLELKIVRRFKQNNSLDNSQINISDNFSNLGNLTDNNYSNSTDNSNNTSLGDYSEIFVDENLKGNFTDEQLSLWEQLKNQSIEDIKFADFSLRSILKIEIEINHKFNNNNSFENEDEKENEFENENHRNNSLDIEHNENKEDNENENSKDSKNKESFSGNSENSSKDSKEDKDSKKPEKESSKNLDSGITGNVVNSQDSGESDSEDSD